MWLDHPRYKPARDRLIANLKRPAKYRFRKLEPVVFLCGGFESQRRLLLRSFLLKIKPQPRVFFAEPIWEQIASREELSALEMESALADLADVVIILVESPGTFAELGAFSLSDALRKKLLPIVDKQFDKAQSFISTGPLNWIDRESDFKPTVYVPFSRVLEAVNEIEERLGRLPKPHQTKVADLGSNPKQLLFFLCDMVAVIQPATVKTVQYYVGQICQLAQGAALAVPTLLGLAKAMGLLRIDQIKCGFSAIPMYSAVERDSLDRPFHHSYPIDLRRLRSDHVSVLLTIPEAKAAIAEVNAKHANRENGN